MDRRTNWKQDVADNTRERIDERQRLLIEKDVIGERIRSLSIAEIKSDLYPSLKLQQREITAKLATL